MIILGVDPGQTTGVCMIRTTDENINNFDVLLAEQVLWNNRHADFWALLVTMNERIVPVPDIVVIENFRLRPGRAMEQVGSTFPSVNVIGLIEAFQYVAPISFELAYQEPAIIGRVQILPEHQELFVGKQHAADAYRHARYYSITNAHKGAQHVRRTTNQPPRGRKS